MNTRNVYYVGNFIEREGEGYALKLAEKQFHFVGASHRIFLISSSMELNFSMKNNRYFLIEPTIVLHTGVERDLIQIIMKYLLIKLIYLRFIHWSLCSPLWNFFLKRSACV